MTHDLDVWCVEPDRDVDRGSSPRWDRVRRRRPRRQREVESYELESFGDPGSEVGGCQTGQGPRRLSHSDESNGLSITQSSRGTAASDLLAPVSFPPSPTSPASRSESSLSWGG